MFNAVIRTPKLCDMFHKAEKKRLTEKEISIANQSAITNLRLFKVDETNSAAFIEDLSVSVHHELHSFKKQNYASSTASFDELMNSRNEGGFNASSMCPSKMTFDNMMPVRHRTQDTSVIDPS